MASESPIGRIDVHSHILPGLDDGCRTLDESLACARMLVDEGYTHCFCTPHVWPDFPRHKPLFLIDQTRQLQAALDAAHIPLTLLPGGEINLRPDTPQTFPEEIVSYGMVRKYVLADIWVEELPLYFTKAVRWLQSQGMKVILAHPERMDAVQRDPKLAEYFAELGLLLQGNLECIGESQRSPRQMVAERYLEEGRYFLLGTDTHSPATLAVRLCGLRRAVQIVGEEYVERLTKHNPRLLLPASN